MNVLRINQTYRKILEYLGKGSPTALILDNLGLNKGNYYKKLNLLEKHGYITKKRIGKILHFELQPKAIKLLSRGVERVNYQKKISIHNLWLTFPILSKPRDWNQKGYVEKTLNANSIDFNTNSINNWRGIYFDYANIKIRVTPSKIMFCPPEIELTQGEDVDQGKNQAVQYVYNVVPKVERLLNVSLSKPDKVSAYVSSQHIAFVNDEFAKYFSDRDIKLEIYDEFGRKRVIVDKSTGVPELEFIDKANAEDDAEKMQSLINATVSGQFDYALLNDSVLKLANNQLALSNDLVEYGKQIKRHIESIVQLGNGVEKLTSLVEQLNYNRTFFSRFWRRFKK